MATVIFSVGVWIPGDGMGNHAYYLVEGLDRHNMLTRAFVMRYTGTGIDSAKIRAVYFTEKLAYRVAKYTHTNQYILRDNFFDFWVAQQLKGATMFYGWTHHALWSLKTAKRLGMVTILERANSHPITYTRLLEAEYQKHGIQAGPYHPLIFKKHLKEIQETDYIAVTSEFTRQSLLENEVDENRILLTPLGVDTLYFVPAQKSDDIFRVGYVGQICLRKGIPYLLEAWSKLQLKQAELLLVGDLVSEMQELLQYYLHQNSTIKVFPHTRDPVSAYQQASVCILPTLEDGFGLVVLEAMACGVPVIITEHTGAKDCVRPNKDGFIIPPYSPDAIADTLLYCYQHRSQLEEMGRNARQQAEQFPWTRYQDGITAHLRRIAP
jgi:glycosyltransferase involved in cell wall biosynthesis